MDPDTLVDGREAGWWQDLRRGDAGAREALLDLHLPYARIVAAIYYRRRHGDEVDFDDYHQWARIGLLEALDRYDPVRGVLFRSFAARRMHGAILNGLEGFTEKQQQIVARQRLQADRAASVSAMAQDAVAAQPAQQPLLALVAEAGFGLALCWLLEGTGLVDDGQERGEALPFYRHAQLRQLRDGLLRLVEALPPQERVVIRSHYLQDLRFEEVARTMGLTKGRISQIHKQALLRLRSQAAALELRP